MNTVMPNDKNTPEAIVAAGVLIFSNSKRIS
jgi:hypothetical protein